jgi:hypothetical protein
VAGEARELPTPAGLIDVAVTRLNGVWAIGEGYRVDPVRSRDGKQFLISVPLRWRLDTGTVEELPVPGPNMVAAVTSGGVAVFSGITQPVTSVAPDGAQGRLPQPDGLPQTFVDGVSDDGRTVGGDAYGGPNGASVPYLWRC